MSARSIKSKRELFCCWYAALGSVQEAAIKAGFSQNTALSQGLECLSDPVCRSRIAQFRRALSDTGCVAGGLRRLAFGSCADAVSLAFADELPTREAVKDLDLFCVSEIKRDKNGGVEIKLFDRMKAMEKLFELERAGSENDAARCLIEALTAPGEEGGSNDP